MDSSEMGCIRALPSTVITIPLPSLLLLSLLFSISGLVSPDPAGPKAYVRKTTSHKAAQLKKAHAPPKLPPWPTPPPENPGAMAAFTGNIELKVMNEGTGPPGTAYDTQAHDLTLRQQAGVVIFKDKDSGSPGPTTQKPAATLSTLSPVESFMLAVKALGQLANNNNVHRQPAQPEDDEAKILDVDEEDHAEDEEDEAETDETEDKEEDGEEENEEAETVDLEHTTAPTEASTRKARISTTRSSSKSKNKAKDGKCNAALSCKKNKYNSPTANNKIPKKTKGDFQTRFKAVTSKVFANDTRHEDESDDHEESEEEGNQSKSSSTDSKRPEKGRAGGIKKAGYKMMRRPSHRGRARAPHRRLQGVKKNSRFPVSAKRGRHGGCACAKRLLSRLQKLVYGN